MRYLLLLSAAAMAASAHGGVKRHDGFDARLKRTTAYLKCNDDVDLGAFKNTQWNACSEAELARAEAKLSLAYRKLELSLSDPKQVSPDADGNRGSKLLKSQGSWQRFRDDFCGFEAGSGDAPNPENIELECRIDLTWEQVTRIESAR